MKKLLAVLLMAAMLLPTLASAQEVVNVFNCEDYIADEVLDLFEQETGIKVNYMNYTGNEDMLVSLYANPGAYDVVFPSEYCVERLLANGDLAVINYDNIPNAQYILPSLRDPSYDPGNAHSVPYMWGTVGILYNTTMVDEPVDSWGILWNDKYANNVIMIDSIRDSLGITLKYLGHSMNTRDIFALEEATQMLIDQKKRGIVKAYQLDETKDKMVAGEAALAVVYSGDAQYAIDLNPDLAYAIPKEGSNVWVDCMVIPATARNQRNAEIFINFMCRPDIARMNCEAIRYSSTNTGAIELMGEEYTSNTTMNPSAEALANCEYFNDIQDFIDIYNALWNEVKMAK